MKIIIIAIIALGLTGCEPDPNAVKDIRTRYVEIDGHQYLAQWVTNGHGNYWAVVAGPIK